MRKSSQQRPWTRQGHQAPAGSQRPGPGGQRERNGDFEGAAGRMPRRPERIEHRVLEQRAADAGPCTTKSHSPIYFDKQQSGCLGTVDWMRFWNDIKEMSELQSSRER